MKTILVPLKGDDVPRSILETALLVARRFGSYIEGLHVRPGLPRMVVAGDGVLAATTELGQEYEQEAREQARRARDTFETFLQEKGVPREAAREADQPCASWTASISADEDVVGSRGRLFDLIVVGRPARYGVTATMATLEAAVFESGRPILIAPPTPPATIGDHMVIAWNGSTETARTIAFAMPFLMRAQRVLVLSVEEGMVPGPSGGDVARSLQRHGIAAQAAHVRCGGRSVGETILAEAAAHGADLLVKGAYTQSRLRQLIFGGATSHILAAAELPVIMAH